MIFSVTTMGTASAMPISDRNPSAQMLSAGGRLFLIDCGEGTQQQMRRCHFGFVKIEAIFISHIHGDHLFGLFGLLNSMAMYGRVAPLDIYGPPALGSVLNFYTSFFGSEDLFELRFHKLEGKGPELIHTSKQLTVTAFPLNHKIECYGFRFDETVTQRHREANPAYRAKSYAYCSDTAPFPRACPVGEGRQLPVSRGHLSQGNGGQGGAPFPFHIGTGGTLRPRGRGGAPDNRSLLFAHYRYRRPGRRMQGNFPRYGGRIRL